MNNRLTREYLLIALIGLTASYLYVNPVLFPNLEFARLNYPVLNLIFFTVSIAYCLGLWKSAAVRNNREYILLLISIAFCGYLSAGIYFNGYDDALVRLTWILGAIAGISFSKNRFVVLYLTFSTLATSMVHLALPPEDIPYSVISYIIFTPVISGIYYYVISIAVISTKKLELSQRQLRRKTKELDSILNSMQVMVAYKNENNVLLKVNDALAKHLDKPAEELVGESIYDLFPTSVAKRMHEEDLEVIRTGKPMFGLLSEIKKRDKATQWLNIDKMPYYDELGKITGVVVTVDDMTERYVASKKLQESEERFRMIFENAPDGMGLVDCESGLFLKVNHALIAMMGYSEKELLALSPEAITHSADLTPTQEFYTSATQDKRSFYEFGKKLIHKSGRIIDTFLSVHIVYNEGQPQYKIGILKDVTQKKEDERRLKKYARQLEESNQNLQEFAYAASHDLREPLRTVVSYAQLLGRSLSRKEESEQVSEFLTYIVGGAKRMERQITALLDYSRIGNGALHFDQVDLKDTIYGICMALKIQITENNASLEIGELPYVVADPYQMEALFQNLVSNAIKYGKPGVAPEIRIAVEEAAGEWHFSFTDNGMGMEEEYLEKIFAVFRRLHSQEHIPGNGVGLAICRRIVQRHGGKIWAASTPGQGTTIHFTLPTLEQQALFNTAGSAPCPVH
jgi:PAS domain S-box-containing protein